MVRRALRSALFVFALIPVFATALPAQGVDPVLQRVASAWHRGEVAAITGLAARSGISLDIGGGSVAPLAVRQSAAALRRVFDDRESVSALPTMSRSLGGQPARAFGEITWTTKARGTMIPERATLFVAFVEEDGRWRITEIRLLR